MNFLESLEDHSAEKRILRNSQNVNVLHKEYDPYQCPFAPSISNNSRILMMNKSVKPLQDRFPEIIEEKNARFQKALNLKKMEDDREVSQMKTAIKKKQEQVFGMEPKPRDVYLENKKWHAKKLSKINEMIADKIESEIHHIDHTFKPKINNNIVTKFEGQNFLQRQKIFKQQKNINQQKINKTVTEPLIFQPRLNKKSLKMAEKISKTNKENLSNFNLQFKHGKVYGEVEFLNSDDMNAQLLVHEFSCKEHIKMQNLAPKNAKNSSQWDGDWDRGNSVDLKGGSKKSSPRRREVVIEDSKGEDDESDYSSNPKRHVRRRGNGLKKSNMSNYGRNEQENSSNQTSRRNKQPIFKSNMHSMIQDQADEQSYKKAKNQKESDSESQSNQDLSSDKELNENEEEDDDDEDNPYIKQPSSSNYNPQEPSENKQYSSFNSQSYYYSDYSQEQDKLPPHKRTLPSPRLYSPPNKHSYPRTRVLLPERGESPAIVINELLPEEKLQKLRRKEKRLKMVQNRSKSRYNVDEQGYPVRDLYSQEKIKKAASKKKLAGGEKKKKKKKPAVKKSSVVQKQESDIQEKQRRRLERRIGTTYTTDC